MNMGDPPKSPQLSDNSLLQRGEELDDVGYNAYIERMRREQYPMLQDGLYLDHAGTTPAPKLLMDRFHADMVSTLYGNPHSFSQASHRTAEVIERARARLLGLVNADSDHFDVVFTANTTAAIKLVGDALRDRPGGFTYRYHFEAHTSLVGLRALAESHDCLAEDSAVETWLSQENAAQNDAPLRRPHIFGFPAQSNLNGRRLPIDWCAKARERSDNTYTLLDAAALVVTSPLDLSDPARAPDFTVFSLYKIFGFPDLGALIIRKESGQLFDDRRYFGGGTVDYVTTSSPYQHMMKSASLHDRLEDGTLPHHSVIALDIAMDTHRELFGSLERIARHTSYLAHALHHGLKELRHDNGHAVTEIYGSDPSQCFTASGPVVAFNLRDSSGNWVSNTEFEKLAFAKSINVRTGGLCNPGGTATHLNMSSEDLQQNHAIGYRCGSEMDIINGKATGMIRASLGAMSTMSDLNRFLSFIEEFYVEKRSPILSAVPETTPLDFLTEMRIESISIYPIKSCAAWYPPHGQSWPVTPEGLEWDREWCIVHAITGKTLSQKRYTRMALIKPDLRLDARVLTVRGTHALTSKALSVDVPLDNGTQLEGRHGTHGLAEVCGVACQLDFYGLEAIDRFFSDCIGVPCRLARFPAQSSTSLRHSKPHLINRGKAGLGRSIHLSNESPILTITRASLNRLNETIKHNRGKAASPAVFRANIVLANSEAQKPGQESPYAEDCWSAMRIGQSDFEFLGGCRRCQMVCIDQSTAEKNEEPLATLAKTRRINGKIMFGVHTALLPPPNGCKPMIAVGQAVSVI